MKKWYVYKILFEDSSYYIGYRSCKSSPENDFLITYFSSSKEVKSKISNNIKYSGKILFISECQKESYLKEQQLIFESLSDKFCLNKKCFLNSKFGIITENMKQKISIKIKERWKDPEYKEKLSNKQAASWTETRKNNHSIFLKEIFWTDQRKKDHGKKVLGNPGSAKIKGMPKPFGFGEKISKATKGKSKSLEHKKSLSEAAKNRTVDHRNKLKQIRLNTPKKECPHCNKLFDVGNYAKYHGEKCKFNPLILAKIHY